MKRSQNFSARAARIPGGVNSPGARVPLGGRHAAFHPARQGRDGLGRRRQRYIDYVGSWGPLIVGHAHPEVVRAVQQAADRGLSFGAPTEAEVEMAELLVQARAVARAGAARELRAPRRR